MPPVSVRTPMEKVDLWGSGSSNRFDRPRLWTCGNALVYLFIHLSSLHNDRALAEQHHSADIHEQP